MTGVTQQAMLESGTAAYQRWRDELLADSESRALYEQILEEKSLWLQVVEARLDVGLTQAQLAQRLDVKLSRVAKLEKRGFENCTLGGLRRYVRALGEDYELEVRVRKKSEPPIQAVHRTRKAATRQTG